MQWNKRSGKYWMLQWGWPIWFSLGLHVDRRFEYIDLHLCFFILTIIINPGGAYREYSAWWSSRDASSN